jgi:hypothetical protein
MSTYIGPLFVFAGSRSFWHLLPAKSRNLSYFPLSIAKFLLLLGIAGP